MKALSETRPLYPKIFIFLFFLGYDDSLDVKNVETHALALYSLFSDVQPIYVATENP